MAKARAIVKRRKAVRNIRKITQTMQLIATARFQKCLQRAVASKPYTERITQMIEAVSSGDSVEHPLLRPNAAARRTLLLTISSNRGLCGAYNASVLRNAFERRRGLEQGGQSVEMEMVGKKGINYARFLRVDLTQRVTNVEDRIAYSQVAEMAERYMRRYVAGELARVEIAYMRFVSVALQRPTVVQLLPIERGEPAGEEGERRGPRAEFEFSPDAEMLLGRLIPETVKIRLYQCFNDAIVSEQVSRMVAMKAATDSAGEMIKFLTREYNRARQSQITLELADIVGGAEAVKA
ncbi:MAG TPA: ATP synthase F1 subunit gamma [Phycisphaerae bacterium]|nr:ATP synthase F1 subunit gamma [Phycisphaerae bacterium]